MARRIVSVLHPKDNVATALVELQEGASVEADRGEGAAERQVTISVRTPIPFGHKIALQPIAKFEPVLKYGEVIGLATADIAAGEHVHVHNVESQRGRGDLAAKAAS